MRPRVGQQLCRIVWRNNCPGIEVGTVTEVTSQRYRIGEAWYKYEWEDNWKESIKNEYLWWFHRFDLLMKNNIYTVHEAVCAIAKIRRLECKLKKVKEHFPHNGVKNRRR